MWVLLAILTALSEALKDVFSKISLKTSNPIILAFGMRMFALPFLLPLLFFIEIPEIGSYFIPALFAGGLMNVFITIIYMKAIQHSDLSVTVPMVTFTPLFLLITSPIIVGEFPDLAGVLGVIAIVIGSYFLQFNARKKGFLTPFKALLQEKGPRLMLLVAFLWSITANIDKVGILNSSPIFWVISVSSFLFIGMIPVVLIFARKKISEKGVFNKGFFIIGLFTAATLIFQMTAIQMTLVAYVISIKRTSALMAVIFGAIFFKETGFKNRLIGVIIMLIGVLLITL
ncbi:MAG: EamA family transporter [Bacteroidota bacterium]